MYIFVFRARGSAYRFYEKLKKEGIPASVISTPFLNEGGCSLSVRVRADYFDGARKVLSMAKINFFSGAYFVSNENGRNAYRKL